MDDYIDVLALALLMHLAPKTIRNLLSTAPWRLPPECTPPGSNRRIWRRKDVDDWMAAQVRATVLPPRRPGRPRKTPAKVVHHG
jgi:hypothetical protein